MPGEAELAAPESFRRGELVCAACATVLLVSMFALQWYGLDALPVRGSRRTSLVGTENGWHALTAGRWLMLLTVLAALVSILLHATQRGHGAKTSTGGFLTSAGLVASAFLIYRVLIDLPSADRVVDQKLGALIGLLGALGFAAGGWQAMREERGLVHASRSMARERTRASVSRTPPGARSAPGQAPEPEQ
jgi:hypothetical protein